LSFGAIAFEVAARYWGGVAIAYIGMSVSFFQQTRFIFSISVIQTTRLFNLSYQEVWLPVPAGDRKVERIHGWWMPAATNAKVLLYLHGNGINIRLTLPTLIGFHQLGFPSC